MGDPEAVKAGPLCLHAVGPFLALGTLPRVRVGLEASAQPKTRPPGGHQGPEPVPAGLFPGRGAGGAPGPLRLVLYSDTTGFRSRSYGHSVFYTSKTLSFYYSLRFLEFISTVTCPGRAKARTSPSEVFPLASVACTLARNRIQKHPGSTTNGFESCSLNAKKENTTV